MKKTSQKAQQLQLVRNVVRELNPDVLAGVVGGAQCAPSCNPSCAQSARCLQSGASPTGCGASDN